MDDQTNKSFRPGSNAWLKQQAQLITQQLTAEGWSLHPLPPPAPRALARQFWSQAWMKNLARSETYGFRLSPGRTLLRCGCVLDLQIATGKISGIVCDERSYEVSISILPVDSEQLDRLRILCLGHVSSWIDLLSGYLNPELLLALCQPESGILPSPQDWKMQCNCDDWADLCRHAAALLYGVGVLLDQSPELLFTLRGITPDSLLPKADSLPLPSSTPSLPTDKLSSLFGIDLSSPQ